MALASGVEPASALAARPPLGELAGRVRPVAMAGERVLPVLAPLASLFPEGGLRRGTVVSVTGSVPERSGGSVPERSGGSSSLALALLAGASGEGSWCAAVGLSSLGIVAAEELGVALDRFPLVAAPPNAEEWAWAVAALLDAVDIVLARPPAGRPVRDVHARRLAARARERSAVLIVTAACPNAVTAACPNAVTAAGGAWPGGAWPGGADVRLETAAAVWEGIGEGHGRLRARRMEVVAGGRGAASRERRVSLWLPGPDGGVAAVIGGDPLAPGVPAVAEVGAAGPVRPAAVAASAAGPAVARTPVSAVG